MRFYAVSPVGVVGADYKFLTYASDLDLAAGQIVEIPVGRRRMAGVILKTVEPPSFACKEITRPIFQQTLPEPLLVLHNWLSEYYIAHPGTVWQTMLPAGLLKNHRPAKNPEKFIKNSGENRTKIVYTADQKRAIDEFEKMPTGTGILLGRTGSGKTAVYKKLAQDAIKAGRSAMILVPEIALTTQLVENFRRDFPNVILTHSTMTDAQRFMIWQKVLESDRPAVIIGPRSALFLPVKNLGLVVVDECHEPSYHQEKSPRYNALRAAAILAGSHKAKLILGSATPPIGDIYLAKKLGRPIVQMNQLARPDAVPAQTEIVDLTSRSARAKNPIFSAKLLQAMSDALANHKQILLFHNRRGTASLTLCENCGWTALCPRCILPLTLHSDQFQLRCHVCGLTQKIPTACPNCGAANIVHKGIGTKRIETEAKRLFPSAKVARFDGDSTRGQTVAELYDDLKSGAIDIIIGTQQIAKGLDLPKLNLVGIVQADAGLNLPDFAASERTFQLISQAAGRVGRGRESTRVIVQTFQPQHPAVIFGARQNYAEFYKYEIQKRRRGHFPPFAHLLKLTCQYKTERGAINASKKLAEKIAEKYAGANNRHSENTCHSELVSGSNKNSPAKSPNTKIPIKLLGPTPAFYERARDQFRWQIIVRAGSRQILQKIAALVPAAHWQVELDPWSLL